MDLEEMMIDYVLNRVTQEEVEEFSDMQTTENVREKHAKKIFHRCQMKSLICS